MKLGFLVVSVAGVLASATATAPATTRPLRQDGLEVVVPQGWRPVGRTLSFCSDPSQVLALTTAPDRAHPRRRGSLLLVLEDHGVNPLSSYPPRRSFALRNKAFVGGCCDMPAGLAYSFSFRDHGRGFTAYLYASDADAVAGVAILNRLRVAR